MLSVLYRTICSEKRRRWWTRWIMCKMTDVADDELGVADGLVNDMNARIIWRFWKTFNSGEINVENQCCTWNREECSQIFAEILDKDLEIFKQAFLDCPGDGQEFDCWAFIGFRKLPRRLLFTLHIVKLVDRHECGVQVGIRLMNLCLDLIDCAKVILGFFSLITELYIVLMMFCDKCSGKEFFRSLARKLLIFKVEACLLGTYSQRLKASFETCRLFDLPELWVISRGPVYL